ncbi:hypothetical protein ERO13_D01G053450v2 [Gossypium hirsutum]|nr:hypothetical protein ERO13_D01G053450v2 [Gossypium hirsutum]
MSIPISNWTNEPSKPSQTKSGFGLDQRMGRGKTVFGGKERERKSDPKERKRRHGLGGGRKESWGLVMSLCGRSEGEN